MTSLSEFGWFLTCICDNDQYAEFCKNDYIYIYIQCMYIYVVLYYFFYRYIFLLQVAMTSNYIRASHSLNLSWMVPWSMQKILSRLETHHAADGFWKERVQVSCMMFNGHFERFQVQTSWLKSDTFLELWSKLQCQHPSPRLDYGWYTAERIKP